MEKRLQIYVNKDGSVEFKTALPTIYQYEDYVVYFDFEFESQPADEASVQIMFRRSDGKTSAYLPLVTTNYQKKLYSIKLDNPWFWYKPGLLTFKVNTLTPSGEKNYSTFSSDYASIDIIAVPDTTFMAPPMSPSAYDELLLILNNKLSKEDFEENLVYADVVKDIVAGQAALDGASTTIYYTTTGGLNKEVKINLPDNHVTIEELHDINPIVGAESNGPLSIKLFGLREDEVVDIELPDNVTTDDEIQSAVFYTEGIVDDASVPAVEAAIRDGEGNIISETYAKKDTTNEFLEPQTFNEGIDIKNANGTVTSIKDLGSNFTITTSDEENLIDIDKELKTVSFFNKDVVYAESINPVLNLLYDSMVVGLTFVISVSGDEIESSASNQITSTINLSEGLKYTYIDVGGSAYSSTYTIAYKIMPNNTVSANISNKGSNDIGGTATVHIQKYWTLREWLQREGDL